MRNIDLYMNVHNEIHLKSDHYFWEKQNAVLIKWLIYLMMKYFIYSYFN